MKSSHREAVLSIKCLLGGEGKGEVCQSVLVK